MTRLYLIASRLFGGGTVAVIALGCLLASHQTARADKHVYVEFCPVPAYCSPFSCYYNALFTGTCTYSNPPGGSAFCDCLWP